MLSKTTSPELDVYVPRGKGNTIMKARMLLSTDLDMGEMT